MNKYGFKNNKINKAIRTIKRIPTGAKVISSVILASLIVAIILLVWSCSNKNAVENETEAQSESVSLEEETVSEAEDSLTSEEKKAKAKADAIINELASYGNLGIINCETHVFMREQPTTDSNRIGTLKAGAACSLIAPTEEDSNWYDTDEWQMISSGGIKGYVKSEYLYTGDEAKEKAKTYFERRAVVLSDSVNVRERASSESKTLAQVYKGERYDVLDVKHEWVYIQLDEVKGYVKKEFVEVRECLDAARRLMKERDKETALNLYTNLGITSFDSGLKNVRTGPGLEYRIVGMLTPNCAVQIEEDAGEWLKIKSGPVEGYVKSEFIMTGFQARDRAMNKIQLMAISSEDGGLNVRSGPGTDYDVISSIAQYERYPVIGQTNSDDGKETWVQIDLGDTDEDGNIVSAYVRNDLVTVRYAINEAFSYSEDEIMAANSDSRRASIVAYALQFVGGRYVWGGTSLTNGCDCSGFTQSVLKNFGISIPRTSRDQANAGRKITSAELRPGDLIFYANSSGTINHVTMYIGGGRIVGAQSKKSGIKTAAWNYRTPVKIVNIMGD